MNNSRNGHIARRLFALAAPKLMGTVTHVTTKQPLVALTFDDGPDSEFTPRLLEILEKFGARASFFMIGQSAARHPELVRQVAQSGGHVIGNHSWDHPSFPTIASRERRKQLQACKKATAPFGQRLFRPPYGDQSVSSRFDALLLRYEVVMGNLDVEDWWVDDPNRMADQLINGIRPGTIVLLHDAIFGSNNRKVPHQPLLDRRPMLAALEMFLERTRDRFRFVTLPELLRSGEPQRESWYVKGF